MFVYNWPSPDVHIVCLRELLFCVSIVIATALFMLVTRPRTCSVYGFATLLSFLWLGLLPLAVTVEQENSSCLKHNLRMAN
jgi:hypothetical protein